MVHQRGLKARKPSSRARFLGASSDNGSRESLLSSHSDDLELESDDMGSAISPTDRPSDRAETLKMDSNGSEEVIELSPEDEKKLLWKIDLRLVSVLGLMYSISLMDRTNLSLVKVAGMEKELHMDGKQYSIIVLVFFIPYIIFEFPSTVLVRKFGPRVHLGVITFAWGIVMIGCGFVNKWTDLAILRVMLGLFEAGFFPGCVYLLSTWYLRYEVHKRYSVFYLIGSLLSALAGVLAYGFTKMNGLGHLTGWRWVFVMQGILTCLVALVGYWLLVDFPDQSHKVWRFLTEKEMKWIVRRLDADRGDVKPEPFNLKKFCAAALDFKLWCFAMCFFCLTTVTYAIAYFLPSILGSMGFKAVAQLVLSTPPYAVSAIFMYATAWVGDKYHIRAPIIVFNCLLTIIGLPLVAFAVNRNVRYAGIFITIAGANANIPSVMAYQANNILGQWKRAVASALLVGFGGMGGIAGSLIFRPQDAPGYRPGIIACLALNCFIVLIVTCLTVYFMYCNKKQASGKKVLEGKEGFRYTL